MKFLKKVSPFRLIFLIILLAGNTFAWFIYTSKVDGAVNVHVKGWDVVFQAQNTELSHSVDIDVSSIYPGMEDYEYEITAYNRSEVSANLTYVILEANVLGTNYVSVEGRADRGEDPVATDLTSAQLLNKLANDFPFTITFTVTGSNLQAELGEQDCVLEVVWPFEQNDDETDTEWGIAAATYKSTHPDLPSISVRIKLTITQNPS